MQTPPTDEPTSTSDDIIEGLRAAVEARAAAEVASLTPPGKPAEAPITSEFVLQCLNANELGDGLLYAVLHRGLFLFNATSGEWLYWAGHHWLRDFEGRAAHAVEAVAMRYLEESAAIGRQLAAASDEEDAARLQSRQQRILRRVERLRSVRGRKNCLEMAASCGEAALVVLGDRLDDNPMLLACANGVVDLQTGELRPGRPEDLITLASPFAFPLTCEDYMRTGKNSPCPLFESFVLGIMNGNRGMADYLCRLFGYGITGLTIENIFVILFGHGRNGKSLLIETIQKVLGPLAGPIQAEMLLDQGRVKNSSGPSPDIMSLRGRRLAFASETEQNHRFASSKVKWLSGGDSLTGRSPHDRDITTFAPSHLLCLATNFKPRANPEDRPFWLRMQFVDFCLSFVDHPAAPNERPIDRRLGEKLAAEAAGVLAWLVRGCLLWQREGLKTPAEVTAATAEYRRAEDDLADFLEEKCLIAAEGVVTAKALYASFKDYCEANVGKAPTQKRFGDAMSRRFTKDKNGPGGTKRYLGLELRPTYE